MEYLIEVFIEFNKKTPSFLLLLHTRYNIMCSISIHANNEAYYKLLNWVLDVFARLRHFFLYLHTT